MLSQNDPNINESRVEINRHPLTNKEKKHSYSNQLILTTHDNLDNSKECRICLQPEYNELNPLLSPCQCTGTLKYIHQQCYTNWLQHLLDSKSDTQRVDALEKGVECELCKQSLSLTIMEQTHCKNIKQVSKDFKIHKSKNVSYILLILLNAMCIGLLTNSISQNHSTPEYQKITILLSLCLLIISCLQLFLLIHLIKMAFFKQQLIIAATAIRSSSSFSPSVIKITSVLPRCP